MNVANVLHVDFCNSKENINRCVRCGYLNIDEDLFCFSCSSDLIKKDLFYNLKKVKLVVCSIFEEKITFIKKIENNKLSRVINYYSYIAESASKKFNCIIRYNRNFEFTLIYGLNKNEEYDSKNAVDSAFYILDKIEEMNSKINTKFKAIVGIHLSEICTYLDLDQQEKLSKYNIIFCDSISNKIYNDVKTLESIVFCSNQFKNILRDEYIFKNINEQNSDEINFYELKKKVKNSIFVDDCSFSKRKKLFGRNNEIDQLLNCYNTKGYISCMFYGEAGIGKSALSKEIIFRLKKKVVELKAQHNFKNSPFYPFISFLKSYFCPFQSDTIVFDIEEKTKKIGINFNEYLYVFSEIIEVKFPKYIKIIQLCAEDVNKKIKDLIIKTIRYLGSDLDFILFIEDIHWADSLTLDVLNEFVTEYKNVSIIVTSRYLYKDIHVDNIINLNPLSWSEVRSFGLFLCPDLSDTDIQSLIKRSEGNPLFIEEIVKQILEGGGGCIPDSIYDLLSSKLSSLSFHEKKLLKVMSIVGESVAKDFLVKILKTEQKIIADSLENLLSMSVLCQLSSGEFDFHHVLLAEVMISTLTHSEKIKLHDDVACVLKKIKGKSELIAHHYEHATRYDIASYFYLKAGEDARKKYLHKEALCFFHKSILYGKSSNNIKIILNSLKNIYYLSSIFIFQEYFDGFDDIILFYSNKTADKKLKFEIYFLLSYRYDVLGDSNNSMKYFNCAKFLYNENKIFFLNNCSSLVARYIALEIRLVFFCKNKIKNEYKKEINFFLEKLDIRSYVIVISSLMVVSFLSKQFVDVFLFSKDIINRKEQYEDPYYNYLAELHMNYILICIGKCNVDNIIKIYDQYCTFAKKDVYNSYWSLVIAEALKISGNHKESLAYIEISIDCCEKTGFFRYYGYLKKLFFKLIAKKR
ncbi:MAG: AAA family ATPase [Alphaproteobacteria bacterium]|nr:AAA family ATPase [Alphaproteobacteria bacterium]